MLEVVQRTKIAECLAASKNLSRRFESLISINHGRNKMIITAVFTHQFKKGHFMSNKKNLLTLNESLLITWDE